jgi:hypothetical protein
MYDTIQKTPRAVPVVLCLLAASVLVALGFLPFMRSATTGVQAPPGLHAAP